MAKAINDVYTLDLFQCSIEHTVHEDQEVPAKVFLELCSAITAFRPDAMLIPRYK